MSGWAWRVPEGIGGGPRGSWMLLRSLGLLGTSWVAPEGPQGIPGMSLGVHGPPQGVPGTLLGVPGVAPQGSPWDSHGRPGGPWSVPGLRWAVPGHWEVSEGCLGALMGPLEARKKRRNSSPDSLGPPKLLAEAKSDEN